jgi:hypothetical protein
MGDHPLPRAQPGQAAEQASGSKPPPAFTAKVKSMPARRPIRHLNFSQWIEA